MKLRSWISKNSDLAALLLVGAVYLLTIFLLPKEGFWVVDNANKFLQLRGYLEQNLADTSLPWPGAEVDPVYEYNPIPAPFSVVRDGKLYSVFSPVFPALSALPFQVFGFRGLFLIPLLSAIGMLAGLGKIAAMAGGDPRVRTWTILLAGLCTPIWFYSVVFWEHTVAVGLCVWAIYFFLRFLRDPAWKFLYAGSALAAGAVYFRDELYLFCLILVGAIVFSRRTARLRTAATAISTMGVCLIPLWWFQWWMLGTPFGFHLSEHLFSSGSLMEHLSARPAVLHNLFLASHPDVWISLAIAGPICLAFLWRPRWSPGGFRMALPVYGAVASIGCLVSLCGYINSGRPIAWLLQSNGLFAMAPLLILGALRRMDSGSPTGRLIGGIATAYALLYGLAAPLAGSSGIHWGNRFLLVLYPLLILLAVENLGQWSRCQVPVPRWGWAVVAAVVLLSFTAQVGSIHLLHRKKGFTARLNRTIQERPEKVVVTNVPWAPQEMYSVFFDKSMFYIDSQEELEALADKLRNLGLDTFLFVSRPRRNMVAVAEVPDDDLRYYSVAFSLVRLSGDPITP